MCDVVHVQGSCSQRGSLSRELPLKAALSSVSKFSRNALLLIHSREGLGLTAPGSGPIIWRIPSRDDALQVLVAKGEFDDLVRRRVSNERSPGLNDRQD